MKREFLIAAVLGATTGCVTEAVTPESTTIVRALGGTSVRDMHPEDAAQVFAMAMGAVPARERDSATTAVETPPADQDPLDLFPEEQIDSLDLPSATLGEALRLLADSGNVNLILTDPLPDPVQLSLHGVTLREAVRSLVKRYQLRVERDGPVLMVGVASGTEVESRLFQTRAVSAKDLEEAVRGMLSDQGQMTVSPSGNALFIRDVARNLAEITEFLDAVDAKEPQVAIIVRIFEVGFDDNFELGFLLSDMNISIDDTTMTFLSNLLTPQTDVVTTVTNKSGTLNAVIDALNAVNTLDLLSMPRVTVLSGREAFIEIITRIPYVQALNSVDTEGGSTTTTETIEFEEVGITLTVTPVVQNDGHIRLVVEPEVSEAVDFFNGVPVVDRRKVQTEVMVEDQGTVFLGGLFRNNVFKTVDKVPLLGDIPYVGSIFRRTIHRHRKSELIVQITPYLVHGDEDSDPEAEPAQDRFELLRAEAEEKVEPPR